MPEVERGPGQGVGEPENFVRGQAFYSLTEAAVSILGPSARPQVLASVSAPLREAFQYGSLVRSGWYPIEWHAELHRAIAALDPSPNRNPSIHRRLGSLSAETDINTVYRFILSLSTPQFLLAQLGRVFGTFVKTSAFEVLRKESHEVDLKIRILGATPALWEDLAGSAETLLGVCGAKSPRATWSAKRHASECEMRTSWG